MVETTHAKLRKFGKAVRAGRIQLGLSQEKFAERCDLHRTYIGSIERGEANVTFQNIAHVCRALGMKPSQLWGRAGL